MKNVLMVLKRPLLNFTNISMCLVIILGGTNAYCEPRMMTVKYGVVSKASPNAARLGVPADIMVELSKRIGFNLEFTLLPAKRRDSMMKDGSIDIQYGYKTPEREEEAYYLDNVPVLFNTIDFFVRADEVNKIRTFDDLSGKKIGIIRGFRFLPKQFSEADRNAMFEIVEVSSGPSLIKMLQTKRLDVVSNSRLRTLAYIKELGAESEVLALDPPIIFPQPMFLSLSKKTLIPNASVFSKKITLTLQALYDEGWVQALMEEYGYKYDIGWCETCNAIDEKLKQVDSIYP